MTRARLGAVQDEPTRKPLLQGVGILPLHHVAEGAGVPVERLEALIQAGLITDFLGDENGNALYLLEDSVPSRERLLELLSILPE